LTLESVIHKSEASRPLSGPDLQLWSAKRLYLASLEPATHFVVTPWKSARHGQLSAGLARGRSHPAYDETSAKHESHERRQQAGPRESRFGRREQDVGQSWYVSQCRQAYMNSSGTPTYSQLKANCRTQLFAFGLRSQPPIQDTISSHSDFSDPWSR